MINDYPYITFDYNTFEDERQRELQEFYKILDLFSFDDIMQSSSVINRNLKVSWLDVRSIINGGAYYKVLSTFSSFWNNLKVNSNYNFINRYQTMELSTRNVNTWQKLMNIFKKLIKKFDDISREDNWNVVKYDYQYRGYI